MDHYKYLIIGGGVAGTTAASTIRKKDPHGSLGIVSDEPYYLYSRIMLSKPNFFLGKIPFNQIWLRDKKWYTENNITFLGGKKATRLDSTAKVVTLEDGTQLNYEKLLLATGVCPRPLSAPGADKKGVFYLRTLDQGKDIIASISSVQNAVAVGGGFISFEIANLLRMAGANVSVVIRESRFWENIFDETSSGIIEGAMAHSGVTLIRNAEVSRINGDSHVTSVTLKDGSEIPCELVVCGIGAVCDVGWLKESSIKLDRGILADDHLRTNIPDVWAAGDASQFDDPILEEEVQLGNWVNAQEQGHIAGLNMADEITQFTFVSFYTTHGFDSTITFIGNVRPQQKFETVTRHGPADNQHAQLIIVDDELVGAVLINQTMILKVLSDIIAKNIRVGEKKTQLSDPTFELSSLLV